MRNTLRPTIENSSKFTIKVCDLEIFGHWRGPPPSYVEVIVAVGPRKKATFISSWEINVSPTFLNVPDVLRDTVEEKIKPGFEIACTPGTLI